MPIPEQIDPESLADYLEIMTKAIFQAGVSWAMIDNKWTSFRRAFENFDPTRLAAYSEADIERLTNDASIFRSRPKIEGTITNAKTLLSLNEEFAGFNNYLRSKDNYEALSKDLRKRFKHLGELSVYYFLFRVKQPVPNFDEWVLTIEGEHPRMREMVDLARSKGATNEAKAKTKSDKRPLRKSAPKNPS